MIGVGNQIGMVESRCHPEACAQAENVPKDQFRFGVMTRLENYGHYRHRKFGEGMMLLRYYKGNRNVCSLIHLTLPLQTTALRRTKIRQRAGHVRRGA